MLKEKQNEPMATTLTIPDDIAARLETRAKARGLTMEELVIEWATEDAAPMTAEELQQDPAEWMRRFDAWVKEPRPSTPILSDEAMSRESIY